MEQKSNTPQPDPIVEYFNEWLNQMRAMYEMQQQLTAMLEDPEAAMMYEGDDGSCHMVFRSEPEAASMHQRVEPIPIVASAGCDGVADKYFDKVIKRVGGPPKKKIIPNDPNQSNIPPLAQPNPSANLETEAVHRAIFRSRPR